MKNLKLPITSDIRGDLSIQIPRIEWIGLTIKNDYLVECFDHHGRLVWDAHAKNLTVLEGRNDILQQYWTGSSYTAAHYMLITAATPVFAPGDTMASHPGWTEITDYDEGARPTVQMGVPASGSIDNSANRCVYTVNADGLTTGGFAITTDATKGGAIGKLFGGVAYAQGNNPINTGYVLRVQVTSTMNSA